MLRLMGSDLRMFSSAVDFIIRQEYIFERFEVRRERAVKLTAAGASQPL